MSTPDFRETLMAAGFSSPEQVVDRDRWQVWKAIERSTFRETQIYLLFLSSKATWGMSLEVARDIRVILPPGEVYHAVVRSSADIADDLPRVAQEFRAQSALRVRDLLSQGISRWLQLRAEETGLSLDHPFVDPRIQIQATGEFETATVYLQKWLEKDREEGARVGILLAPAGVGKTTVAKQLTINFHKKNFPKRIPLLITPDQWTRLPMNVELSLWDFWKEAVSSMYTSTISMDEFDLYVETGLFLPIFDGFDELCTRYGSIFRATETLEQLLQLLKDTDGHFLLTSRDGFWSEQISADRRRDVTEFTLHPFSEADKEEYIEKRFPKGQEHKRTATAQVLARLSGVTRGTSTIGTAEELTHLPLVIAMAAESVDIPNPESTIKKYGGILDGDDPIEGILLMFMSREKDRHRLSIEPSSQFSLFAELAFEIGTSFSTDDLQLYASSFCDLKEGDSEHLALRGHAILRRVNSAFAFRYDFVADYLIARRLVEYMPDTRGYSKVMRQLSLHARGSTAILEKSAQRLLMTRPNQWKDILSHAWNASFAHGIPLPSRSGLLHLMLTTIQRINRAGPRKQTTDMLLTLLGQQGGSSLRYLYVEGTLHALDLRGLTIDQCHFVASGFSRIIFDSDAHFTHCIFERGLEIENCDGFHEARFDESCRLDPLSRDEIRARQTVGNRLAVTHEQVLATLRLGLEKFRGPIGFRSIKRSGCTRGPIAKSPICDAVWQELESRGIIEFHAISGLGRYAGVNIAPDARIDVHNFLSNSIESGRVRTVIATLLRSFLGK